MIGRKISNYRIIEELGKGAMGTVYKAEQISLIRMVAIKVLPERLAHDPVFVQRFLNEARAIAGLSHPNIVQIYDVGQDENTYYYVMELVAGTSLEELVSKSGAFPLQRACNIVARVAKALGYMHEQGIIHRDIKPSNIMIDRFGTVKVIDFGLTLQETVQRLTADGSILGTIEYMSPEQASGGTATHLSDIYSLGVVFYELLTGRLPYETGTPLELIQKIQKEDPPPPRSLNPDIPPAVEKIILKMMSKVPERRYENYRAFLADLRRFRTGGHVGSRVADLFEVLSRRRFTVTAIAALLLVAVAGRIYIDKSVSTPGIALPAVFGENPKNARSKLAELDIAYRPEIFVEWAARGNTFPIQLFLVAGMSPNAQNRSGSTALMMAAQKGHTDIVRILLESGADVNMRNQSGLSAVHYATQQRHHDIARLLVDQGADTSARARSLDTRR